MDVTQTNTHPTTEIPGPSYEAAHDAAHGPTAGVYYTIFGCLAALTFVTVLVSRVSLPAVPAVIMAFLIAISKATLVLGFFMHVKYDPRVIRLMCVVPIVLTLIAMMALLPDIAMHGPQAAGAPEVAAQILSKYQMGETALGHPDAAGTENAAAAVDSTDAPAEGATEEPPAIEVQATNETPAAAAEPATTTESK